MFNSILDLTEVKAKGRKSAAADKSPAAAKSTGKKSRKMEKVAQVMPPHAIGAYIYFSNATVPRIKTERGCTHAEAFKMAGAEWNQLSEEAKAPFVQKGVADKARYDEQLKMLKSEGYFLLADGTKSTDYDPESYKRKVKSGVVKDLPSPAATTMAEGKRRSDGTSVKNPPDAAGSRKPSSGASHRKSKVLAM